MTQQEYTKQVAIVYAEWVYWNGRLQDWDEFIQSDDFKAIPEADEWIPVSKVKERINATPNKFERLVLESLLTETKY